MGICPYGTLDKVKFEQKDRNVFPRVEVLSVIDLFSILQIDKKYHYFKVYYFKGCQNRDQVYKSHCKS